MTRHDIIKLRLLSARCSRVANDLGLLYHEAVKAKMPLETLSAVARLSMDLAAIHNRVYALRYPVEGAI